MPTIAPISTILLPTFTLTAAPIFFPISTTPIPTLGVSPIFPCPLGPSFLNELFVFSSEAEASAAAAAAAAKAAAAAAPGERSTERGRGVTSSLQSLLL